MFNIVLSVQLVVCITGTVVSELAADGQDISAQSNSTSDESSLSTEEDVMSNIHCEYPKDAFQILVRSQCPVAHPFCIIDSPFDVLINVRYRCATAPRRTDLTVHSMNSSQLLAQISKDVALYAGYSNCMLTAFYAPDCPFSVRMVPYLYHLPRMYPRLRIVITDATDHSKLNSRYGIIGTPTVLLWVDGSAVSRMDEAPFSLKAFKSYIEKWTDLESEFMPTVEEETESAEMIEFHGFSFDWYLCASWLSFVLSVMYFFMNSKYGQLFWKTIRTNQNEANEAQ